MGFPHHDATRTGRGGSIIVRGGERQVSRTHMTSCETSAVREANGKVTYLPPRSDGVKAMRAWRKPKRYESPEDLQQALAAYLDSLQATDGSWAKPPTLSGAGLFLGFNSRSWHEPYAKDVAFKPTIDWLKLFIETWREEQVIMPSKGVYAQGLMFLMNRLDALAVAERTTDVSHGEQLETPGDVKLMLDSLWRRSGNNDVVGEDRTRSAKAEIDKLARMTPHERLIWHKTKQIEVEAELGN